MTDIRRGAYGALALRWLRATLTGDEELMDLVTGVYFEQVPTTGVTPYLIYDLRSPFAGTPQTLEGQTLEATGVLAVRVVGTEDVDALIAVQDRLQELLGRVNLSPIPGGGLVQSSRYSTDLGPFSDTVEQTRYWTIGATYRVTVQPY